MTKSTQRKCALIFIGLLLCFSIKLGLAYTVKINLHNSNIASGSKNQPNQSLQINQLKTTINNNKKQIALSVKGVFQQQTFAIDGQVNYQSTLDKPPYTVNLTVKIPILTAQIKGTINTLSLNPNADVDLQVTGDNLANLIALFGSSFLASKQYSISSHLHVSNNVYQFTQVNGNIWGGTVTGNFTLDYSNPTLSKYNFAMTGQGLSANQALKALNISDQVTSGVLNINYNASSFGDDRPTYYAHQTGNVTMGLTNAALTSRGLATYTGNLFQLLSGGTSKQQVQLNCFVIQLILNDGIGTTKAMALDTYGATVVGKGSINYKNHTINFLIIPTAKRINLNPLAIPMHIRGSTDHPQVFPAPIALSKSMTGTVFDLVSGKTVLQILNNTLGNNNGQNKGASACINALSGKIQQPQQLQQSQQQQQPSQALQLKKIPGKILNTIGF